MMRSTAALVASAMVAGTTLARGETADGGLPRGPTEIRDEQLLAQPRLTLPAVSPWTVRARAWSLDLSSLWSNTFTWDQDAPGENPTRRRYLLDGETVTLDATLRRGLTPNVDVGLRLPLRWRGGGILDDAIDWWHRAFGFPNAHRPDFRRNAFRVTGETTDGGTFDWSDRAGGGLGDVEIETRWRFLGGAAGAPALALVGRSSLPTGRGPFAGNGPGVAGQIALATPLARRFDLYGGVGFTAQRHGPVRGLTYEPARAHGFLAFEWRPARRVSLVAETDAATRLVTSIARYPGTHWMLNVTGRIDLSGRTRLDLGFVEGLKSQRSTTDFALYAGLALRP